MSEEPVLYILMRTDIHSLAGGKGMAQAAHAANQFVAEAKKDKLFKAWEKQAGTFGTTIVLAGGNLRDVEGTIEYANRFEGLQTGLVVDPTFPVRDGDAILTAEVTVCGYVFGDKNGDYYDKEEDVYQELSGDWSILTNPLYPTLDFPEESDY